MKRACCCARRVIRLTEWLYEDGIGEARAILVEQGRIVEARIEREGAIRSGLIAEAKLVKQLVAGKRGIATLSDGSELLLSPLPKGLTEGASLMIEVKRAAISEKTRFKLPLARPAPDRPATPAPTLLQQIEADNIPVRKCFAHEADHFAEAGWHEAIEEARSGQVEFVGGSLIISITPAMALIDVDGGLPPLPLALASAKAAALAIRRLDLQGSIGIDFPGLEAKADRQAVAEAFDAAMTGNFERTAVNGFGFLQLVKRRTGPSLPEILRGSLMRGHVLELLRRAERDHGAGDMQLVGHPAIVKKLEKHPSWLEELGKRTGRAVSLRADPKLAIGGAYAQ